MVNKNETGNYKSYNVRMPKGLWLFAKNFCIENRLTMNDYFLHIMAEHKEKLEKELTEHK